MVQVEDVEKFLKDLNIKIAVFGLIFRDDRGKNIATLLDLEIKPKFRENIIKELVVEDYVDGPLIDSLNKMGELWVFGKDVKGKEIYIKISMGVAGSSAICISFHIAEKKLNYKFRTT